jgi:hypothetical protein
MMGPIDQTIEADGEVIELCRHCDPLRFGNGSPLGQA